MCPLFHKRRGAIVLLIWNFSVFSLFNYSYKVEQHSTEVFAKVAIIVVVALGVASIPLFGLLADVYFGRYTMVKLGLRALWLSSILYFSVKLIPVHSLNNLWVKLTISSVGMFGLASFFANSVQLSMDQFHDASSKDIKSFLYLYYWAYCASKLVVIPMCAIAENSPLLYLLPTVLLTVAVCVEILCQGWIIKEPGTINPLKLIFRVFVYAKKHKHPQRRKANTYWEDKPYSRIDLGKSKYGGPFTIEQVEDVKTFFRITVTILVPSVLYGYFVYGDGMYSSYKALLPNGTTDVTLCYKKLLFSNFGELLLSVAIPLRVMAITMPRYFCHMSILKKLGTGLALILLCMLLFLSFKAYHLTKSSKNENLANCMFTWSISMEDKPWPMIGYSVLTSLGEMLVSVSLLEFVCAQSPYSMKGLLLGVCYWCSGVSVGIIMGIKLLFYKTNPHPTHTDCEFWFIATCTLFAATFYLVFIVASVWYKPRQREDNLPSENYFAENYYEKLLEAGSDTESLETPQYS